MFDALVDEVTRRIEATVFILALIRERNETFFNEIMSMSDEVK